MRLSIIDNCLKGPCSFILIPLLFGVLYTSCQTADLSKGVTTKDSVITAIKEDALPAPAAKVEELSFDTTLYNQKMQAIANGDKGGLWPVKFPYPLPGAILPFKRIVAFYGNLYSKRMGILGEFPKDIVLKKLQAEVEKWQMADSATPVIPALHYIAVTAQGSPGRDGKYRLRMPFHQVDTVIAWAKEINALVFLDIQVASSTVKTESVLLSRYLQLPNVHLGIDPEFSLKNGETPGTKIGSFNSADINDAIDVLADIVKKNHLAPKILIIHRFTQGMVTEYKKIKKIPEVQVVMDMDGWGPKILKRGTYLRYIYQEPVEFTGVKLFYKNDIKKGKGELFQPHEVLKFTPVPSYIQYQ